MTTTINASTTLGLQQTADTSGVLALQTANTTALTLDASQNATFAGYVNAPNTFGFKNRLLNGGMVIDQRNAGASGTASAYTVDRWQFNASLTTKGTWQQNAGAVTPPTGFTNYLGFTSNSAYSVGASEIFTFQQRIEGYNVADLAWGTASAATVTLSFWVRSSLTGTFGGSLRNSAVDRSYPFTYTISAANTWEQKTITVAGDTSGTWLTTSGIGINVTFSVGTGSTYSGTAGSWAGTNYTSATGATSVVGTSGATFYITGVQLEKGSTATSFDYRPYGTELALCQRYYESISYASGTEGIVIGYCQSSIVARYAFPIAIKRAAPTIAYSGTLAVEFGTGSATNVTGISQQAYGGGSVASLYFTVASGLTSGQACCLYANGTTVYVTFSSEL